PTSTSPSSVWPPPPTARATGWWPPTAACSPTATPHSRGRQPSAPPTSTSPSSAWRPPPTGRATGWWPPTAACSPTATPSSTGPPLRPTRTGRSSGSASPSGSDGGGEQLVLPVGLRTDALPGEGQVQQAGHPHPHEDAEVGAVAVGVPGGVGDRVEPLRQVEGGRKGREGGVHADDLGGDRWPEHATVAVVEAVPVRPLQLARHVAAPAHEPVDHVDGRPGSDPDDDDIDEVLQVA